MNKRSLQLIILWCFVACVGVSADQRVRHFTLESCVDCGASSASATSNFVELSKWNGEARLGLTYYDEGRLVTYQLDDHDIEVAISLEARPTKNWFAFGLSGVSNLDFFHQPALNTFRSDCTETDCDGAHRPIEIVDSIAIYHKTKRDHYVGTLNHETGKLWHIKRVFATDANGNSSWGTMAVVGDSLFVMVPDIFLDQATYPVVIDPTFGYTSIGASNDSGYGTLMVACTYTMNSDGGTASSMSGAFWDGGGILHAKMAIYANLVAVPGALVANSSTGALGALRTTKPTNAGEWTSGNITAALSASTVYWLAFAPEGDNVNFCYDSGSLNQTQYGSQSYAAFPADPAPALGTNQSRNTSLYVTYSAASTCTGGPMLLGFGKC